MDWDHSRIFLAVARSGQMLAAARQLRLDHATVGRRITALEEALGVKLIERRTNGCALTPAGERFLASAERIEADMLRVQAELSETDVETAGTVRIGAPDGFGTYFLSSRLGPLMDRHRRLTIQLVPLPRTFSLSKREADVAIVIDRPEAGRLVVRKLTDYGLSFYAARSYLAARGEPADLEALSAHTLVTYVQDMQFAGALNYFPQGFSPQFRRFECAGVLGQAEAVRAGVGIGILHDFHAVNDPALKRILPMHGFSRSYWLVTHADTSTLARVRTVCDFIAQAVQAERAIFTPE
ncbi:LysR family transcriptional regulator [Denitromonas sp.]|uniref:LysR family transcriptional regulator n=1 Tax=Denitromonas sp. TaxID=2734609 RepID=UPI003A886394